MGGSGISCTIHKSFTPHFRWITRPAPHHSYNCRQQQDTSETTHNFFCSTNTASSLARRREVTVIAFVHSVPLNSATEFPLIYNSEIPGLSLNYPRLTMQYSLITNDKILCQIVVIVQITDLSQCSTEFDVMYIVQACYNQLQLSKYETIFLLFT